MAPRFFSFILGDVGDDSDMAETQSFSLKYDGEALAEHTIDVNDLAPALLALSDVIQESNRLANKDGASVSIRVKATDAGSFEVFIQTVHTVYANTRGLLAGEDVTALANLLQILGFLGISVGAPISLILLIRRLSGKCPKKVTEKSPNEIEIETVVPPVNQAAIC
jgi:hypothetical protein